MTIDLIRPRAKARRTHHREKKSAPAAVVSDFWIARGVLEVFQELLPQLDDRERMVAWERNDPKARLAIPNVFCQICH